MSSTPILVHPVVPVVPEGASLSPPSSLWDRLSTWAAEHKVAVYTVGTIAVVATGAGVVYYLSEAQKPGRSNEHNVGEKRKSKRDRRKAKKQVADARKEEEKIKADEERDAQKQPTVESEDGFPEITERTAETFSPQERKDYADKLKLAGNQAYGSKNFTKAIYFYGKAILCKQDPIFYSNRAACFNALGQWDKVVEDTTAALALNSEYVKALNRRANAYEQLGRNSEALLDYTASCIIDGFTNDLSAQNVEKLLKRVAEAKGKEMLAKREKRLPSTSFVTNYLQSFRTKPLPDGLDEMADLPGGTGLYELRKGLLAIGRKTGESYEEAARAFEQALDFGGLGDLEAIAYNMRGTFQYLYGDNKDALVDLSKSIELRPSLTQSYIKRASMHLELGDRAAAAKDFEQAIAQDAEDPDIYYHRAQLHFVLGEFPDAAKDYQKSIDFDRDFIFSHIQLGVTQYKMGSIATSMAIFRRCIKNFDKVPDVYNYYGELLLDQQKYEEAIQKFDTAVDMEKLTKPSGMNVLPLINKALALFQWKQDFAEAEALCQKALIIDPECDIAVATMAQLLLQQGKVTEALKYFESAAQLSRTEGEIINALSYAEATRTQLEVQEKYPQLAARLHGVGASLGGPSLR
ncbi:MAG: TOM (translocase of outer membrane) complex component [Phylliscum demangeonii]|nr:MAG: TOM (translocase of outer membrane) complex component [Phylliscum demangeonii]